MPASLIKTKTPGVEIRHGKSCASRNSGACDCRPTFQAHVWDARARRRIRKTFPSLKTAKAWRQDASVALRNGTLRASDGRTVSQVAREWLNLAKRGEIRNRSGDPYKPSAIRSYEQSLRLRVVPAIGHAKFTAVRRVDLQDLVDRLHARGELSASAVQCTILPLRAMYRRALARGEVAVNPTVGLELPAIRSRRDKIVSPTAAHRLIEALPERDRPLWATAFYAGLRRGELMALRWGNVELEQGVIRVERGWDMKEGEITPKSAEGVRTVPIPSALRTYLEAQWVRGGAGRYVFGERDRPFSPKAISDRAARSWKAAELSGITLHECRHTYASFAIAAGVNAKALSQYMGHANISITLDRYGHLMPGNEAEAASLLDNFLSVRL
jgi:integrase